MTFPLEYHKDVKSRVQPSLPASLALCWSLLLLVSAGLAQVNNASTSAHASAVAPNVAPVRNIAVPDKSVVVVPPKPHPPIHNPNGNNGNQHNSPNAIAYYPYFVPYAVDASADAGTPDATAADADAPDASNDSSNNDDNDPEYQGGPTIFDRRGPGAASYRAVASPTQSSAEQARIEDDEAADSDPEPPPAPTILVFKDGHQLEVANYAIINPTLYDLTPGHPRKIALSDLDLPATEKLNDDHGIVFELPPSAQAN
jgi:hypothetical protein